MTNYEKIKQMSIEEIAELFPCPYQYILNEEECIHGWHEYDCIKCTKQWLESEVEEGDN